MASAILCIALYGAAHVSPSPQFALASAIHGAGWFVFDLVGATGEEVYGRGAVLLVAAAFFGPPGAIIVSGLSFFLLHLCNPGASWIWLLRFWASAPLFGAAGSGYLDEGHIFDFRPAGNALVTGGAIRPEGSLLAFLAVLTAYTLLVTTIHPPRRPNL